MEWTFSAEKSGVYELQLAYMASTGKGRKPQITLELDGRVPYTEAADYELSRVYRDAGAIEQNAKGDDLIPDQVEVERWQEQPLLDTSGLTGRNLCLYLEKGTHTIRLSCRARKSLDPARFLSFRFPPFVPMRTRPPSTRRRAMRRSEDS